MGKVDPRSMRVWERIFGRSQAGGPNNGNCLAAAAGSCNPTKDSYNLLHYIFFFFFFARSANIVHRQVLKRATSNTHGKYRTHNGGWYEGTCGSFFRVHGVNERQGHAAWWKGVIAGSGVGGFFFFLQLWVSWLWIGECEQGLTNEPFIGSSCSSMGDGGWTSKLTIWNQEKHLFDSL